MPARSRRRVPRLLLELEDAEGVVAQVDDPGRPGKADVGDAVLGLQPRQVVVLNLDAAGPELGHLGPDVVDLPGRLGLLVGGPNRALGHVQVGAATALEAASGRPHSPSTGDARGATACPSQRRRQRHRQLDPASHPPRPRLYLPAPLAAPLLGVQGSSPPDRRTIDYLVLDMTTTSIGIDQKPTYKELTSADGDFRVIYDRSGIVVVRRNTARSASPRCLRGPYGAVQIPAVSYRRASDQPRGTMNPWRGRCSPS